MFRQEFYNLLLKSGILPAEELKKIAVKSTKVDVVNEIDLLEVPGFDSVKVAQEIATKFSLRYMDLSNARVPKETLALLKKQNVIKYRAIPIQKTTGSILLAIYDPTITACANDLKMILRSKVDFLLTGLMAWSKLYTEISTSVDDLLEYVELISAQSDKANKEQTIREEDIGEEIVVMVNKIVVEAYIKKASDIHMEPFEKNFRVRFRIDGNLFLHSEPPKGLMLAIISRVKIMAQMDIAEKRKPQDGRIKIKIGDVTVDYRVSSLPTLFGEKIVLRILDKSAIKLDMTLLGLEPVQLKILKDAIHHPYGMCLVTGPTGSGKTTTLYSALAELNTIDSNISTAEDPVEFNIEGINQVNVRKDIGYTFASALKSFLRQDPDIIMVGEIRDRETGEIAVEASLTGHLVLSTLHTNDAPSAIARLLNMEIEPFLISAALNVVVAQRLCRKICLSCKDKDNIKKELLVSYGLTPESAEKIQAYKGRGCNACSGTGYKGRVAIYEVLPITMAIRELILSNATAVEIKQKAIADGMKTLRMSGLTKMAMGLTSLEEVIANSASDTD
ncbi:MAG: Flp pilus assembly complex ATPase component TadA [Oligoflexia bacterium]|nr:Flp pilus assembly complex ATPase component TadA [Oligoflexia bacterium]